MTSHRSTQHKRVQAASTPNIAGAARRALHAPAYIISHKLRTALVSTLIALLAFAATAAALVSRNVTTLIEEAEAPVIAQTHVKKETLVDPNAGKPINMLVLGQDSRDGDENAQLGSGVEAGDHQSDTAIIVQISADRTYINMVSIPRDSIVDAPSCTTSKGTMAARYNVMFNSIFAEAYNFGGDASSAASCTLNAVNALTGLNLTQFVVVDFAGMKNMIDAIGGVDLCVPEHMKDDNTGIDLSRGLHHLDGTTATQYARMRHGTGTGDGSDIYRTTRQQYLVKSILREASKKNLFTQSNQLYQLAATALHSLTMSEGLANVSTLVGLAAAMTKLNTAHMYAQTVPVTAYPLNPNRVVWTDSATQIWQTMAENKPLTLDTSSTQSTSGDNATQQDQSNTDQSATNQSDTSQSQNTTDSAANNNEIQGTLDSHTGLIKQADGTLIDPNTHGIVDPDSGTIQDATTGVAIGSADQYIAYTFCGVTADDL